MGHRTTKSKIKVGTSKAKSLSNISISHTEFYYHFFGNILIVTLPLLVISALILGFAIPHSSARVSSSDNFTVSVLSSCTLSSKVNDEHSISTINGTYNADVGRTTLTTFCNDRNGYVVYAVGDSDNTVGNNKLISSINSNYDIVSGTNTSGSTSQWAMKLSALSNNIGDTNNPGYITNNNNETVATNQGTDTPTIDPSYNNTYGIVPTTWTRVVYKPSGTVNSVSGSSFSTTYSIYTSPTQPAGTYTGQVKYLLTHPSDAPYAKLYMQNVTEWEDEIPNPGDTVLATDIRDGKDYYVTRLADGHIWMTQNLDFDINANTTLNSQTTDLNEHNIAGYYDGYTKSGEVIYWTPTSTATTSSHVISGTSVTNWENQATLPYSVEGGDVYYYTSNSSNADITFDSLDDCATSSHTKAECQHYHRGNYYNWSAAIASNNSANISTINDKAANSICPKGWRLPNDSQTDNEYNEFGRLFYKADITANLSAGNNSVGYKDNGFNKLRSNPYYFVRSGLVRNNTLDNSGVAGAYWPNTASSSTHVYGLYFDNAGLYPANEGNRGFGRTLRCLAR